MSIQVNEFRYVQGENDAEYIKLLKEALDEQKKVTGKAIAKIKELSRRDWIPCSERLPKKNGFYLCTTKDCITILEFIAGNPHYHEESSFVSDVLGKCNSYVVAWMPLPEPYRAERRIDGRD